MDIENKNITNYLQTKLNRRPTKTEVEESSRNLMGFASLLLRMRKEIKPIE